MNTITLTELADLAISNPEAGSVNLTALYSLLQCVLDQLGIGSLKRSSLRGASDQSETGLAEGTCSPDSAGVSARALAQRLARLEQRMDALDQLPTTDALLKQTTSGSAQLVRDMWQLMQLRKKTEANHDGIAKVTLQAVKEAMTTMEDLKERMRQMEEAVRSLGSNLAALPHPEELVLWSHVAEALPQPTRPQNQPSVEPEQQEGQQALRWVGALSTQQAALKEELESLQDQLQQLTLALANKDIPNNIQAHLKSLDDELHSLKRKETQEQRGLQTFYDKLAEFRAESDRQNAATERLLDSCRELESRVSHLEQHRVHMQKRKGSGESGEGQLERGVGDEDASLSQAQQKAISQYLSSLLQDLLPTLPTQDWDWPEVLDKLSKDMEHKLDRVELIPLKQELEDGWRKIKARLKEEPDLGANTPAGFRKKLLERVSCISCDKPANILTGMHLVTVRSTSPRPGRSGSMGPASGDGPGAGGSRPAELQLTDDRPPPRLFAPSIPAWTLSSSPTAGRRLGSWGLMASCTEAVWT
ncbi:hypothetical protein ANANG_G00037520 [Anguilla anguilla]|uniref:DUF4795 domain-containing protein n=1 Tax=Anguilla anguilla TaxID=7936 RepID=A0A9D3MWU2_ANGAN|nr:hypothetical protein ANANG_G00037520 [Anguilla anguilla]